MIPVSGSDPQRLVQHYRCLYFLITVAVMNLSPVLHKFITKYHAVRQKERKSRAFVSHHKEPHFFADLTVVTLLGLFQLCKIIFKIRCLRIGRTVDSGQHLVLLVASPVCTGNFHKLHSLDILRGHKVRPCTQVRKITLLVETDNGIFRKVLNQFYLIGFPGVFHHLDGIGSRKLEPLKLQVLFCDLLHLGFYSRKILFSNGTLAVYIVIESVINGRAYGKLYIRPQSLYCLRHNV